MYLHLGQNVVIKKKNIVGIFDIDNTTTSHITREFLNLSEKKGQVIDISGDIPKVFVLCENKDQYMLYLSQLSSATLLKRWEIDGFE